MKPFELKKVIDPYKNMPEEIKEAFFTFARKWWMGADTYVAWNVGTTEGCDQNSAKIIDDWLQENGCVEGEDVIILYYW